MMICRGRFFILRLWVCSKNYYLIVQYCFKAVAIDVKTRSVTFEDGLRLEYKKLFIATGSK